MNIHIKNFFTSGWDFSQKETSLKSRYQMVNIALLTSGFAFIYGIIINSLNSLYSLVFIESFLVLSNLILFLILRKYKNSFDFVTNVITVQCTFLLLYIIYTTDIESMKFAWIFTYPIVLLYFQKKHNGLYWFVFMFFMILAAPLQSIIDVKITTFQATYISIVLMIVSVIVFFYQIKMNEATRLIFEQQGKLENFNKELELKVEEKTSQLQELNESLEIKVKEKLNELIAKDKLLTTQSKQAVMGEMISMIAHQWRQPLSTVTLLISNLHFKRMLGEDVPIEESDRILKEISDTIVYLSDTIEDFKTYFDPNKKQDEVVLDELIQKAINFINPRTKSLNIEIINKVDKAISVQIYSNEMIQVLLNIMNNAIDAFIQNEQKDAKLIVSAKEKEGTLEIYIEDNAGGIKEENLSKIFEPYFSTKGKNGTGLGLYMSQMIVEKQFQGKINVESTSNKTKFTIKISLN